MYEAKGRQFLVMMSPAPGTGTGAAAAPNRAQAAGDGTHAPHGYIAFALPVK
jgi:hypothetical protein